MYVYMCVCRYYRLNHHYWKIGQELRATYANTEELFQPY